MENFLRFFLIYLYLDSHDQILVQIIRILTRYPLSSLMDWVFLFSSNGDGGMAVYYSFPHIKLKLNLTRSEY